MSRNDKAQLWYLAAASIIGLALILYLVCREMDPVKGVLFIGFSVLIGWIVSMALIGLTASRFLKRTILYMETWGPNGEHGLKKIHFTCHSLAYERSVGHELRLLLDDLVDEQGFKLVDIPASTWTWHYRLETEDGLRRAEVFTD